MENEYIDIVALIQSKSDIAPSISMNERDIIDSDVIFSEYRPAEVNANMRLIDRLPRGFANIFKWVIVGGIIIGVFLSIFVAYFLIDEERKNSKPRIWVKYFVLFACIAIILLFCAPLLWIF